MISEDLLNLLIGLLALIPLSFPIRFIPNRAARYSYSFILGVILQIYVFGAKMYPIYVQHIIVFAIIKLKGPRCGGLVTLQSMVYLSSYHIYQYLFNYGGWSMNASALLMILVCKYSLLAYNLEDGASDPQKQTQEQKRNRISNKISFLDFLGYANFLPTALVGPPLEYNDYKDFMESKTPYDKIPSVFPIVGKTLAQALFCGVIYVLSDIYMPISYILSDQFFAHGAWYALFYSAFAVFLARFKYYFGWKISIAAVHASGTSYSGNDFKRINTANPYVVETTIHVRQKIANWNISVQQWLRKCIYNRSSIKNKTVSQLYVFVISSFWHGFYSAYYISFLSWFMQLYMQGLVFKFSQGDSVIVKIYKKSGIAGFILLSIPVQILFNHCGTYFLMLDGNACLRLLSKVHYIPQIIFVLLIVLFTIIPVKKTKRPVKNQELPASSDVKKSD